MDFIGEYVEQRRCFNETAASYNFFITTATVGPINILIGTIGNILSLITVRSTSFACPASTRFILSTMLVVDQAVLLCALLPFWLRMTFAIDPRRNIIGCSLVTFLSFYPRQLSAFMVCLLTVERLIAVYVPLRCKQLCSARRIKMVCLASAIIYFLLNVHNLISGCYYSYDNGLLRFISLLMKVIGTFIDHLLCTFIPATLLFVLNALIVYKIVASRCAMQTSHSASASGKLASTTVILFAEFATFLMFNLPSGTYIFWVFVAYDTSEYCAIQGIINVVTVLAYSSSALNFVMYMLTGSKFRKAFKNTFRRSNTPV